MANQANQNVPDDCDNIDFANYKGIYAGDDNDAKYTCPVTGAHFEFNDLCRRINRIMEKRKLIEQQIQSKHMQLHSKQKMMFQQNQNQISAQKNRKQGSQQKYMIDNQQKNHVQQQQQQQFGAPQQKHQNSHPPQAADFESSIMSISERLDARHDTNVDMVQENQKAIKFKNKFDECGDVQHPQQIRKQQQQLFQQKALDKKTHQTLDQNPKRKNSAKGGNKSLNYGSNERVNTNASISIGANGHGSLIIPANQIQRDSNSSVLQKKTASVNSKTGVKSLSVSQNQFHTRQQQVLNGKASQQVIHNKQKSDMQYASQTSIALSHQGSTQMAQIPVDTYNKLMQMLMKESHLQTDAQQHQSQPQQYKNKNHNNQLQSHSSQQKFHSVTSVSQFPPSASSKRVNARVKSGDKKKQQNSAQKHFTTSSSAKKSRPFVSSDSANHNSQHNQNSKKTRNTNINYYYGGHEQVNTVASGMHDQGKSSAVSTLANFLKVSGQSQKMKHQQSTSSRNFSQNGIGPINNTYTAHGASSRAKSSFANNMPVSQMNTQQSNKGVHHQTAQLIDSVVQRLSQKQSLPVKSKAGNKSHGGPSSNYTDEQTNNNALNSYNKSALGYYHQAFKSFDQDGLQQKSRNPAGNNGLVSQSRTQNDQIQIAANNMYIQGQNAQGHNQGSLARKQEQNTLCNALGINQPLKAKLVQSQSQNRRTSNKTPSSCGKTTSKMTGNSQRIQQIQESAQTYQNAADALTIKEYLNKLQTSQQQKQNGSNITLTLQDFQKKHKPQNRSRGSSGLQVAQSNINVKNNLQNSAQKQKVRQSSEVVASMTNYQSQMYASSGHIK